MRPTICRECYTIMEGSAWPLCDVCTQKRVTEAVATPLDIPVLWDDVPELPKYDYASCDACGGRFDPDAKRCPSCGDAHKLSFGRLEKYESSDDIPTVPTGTTPPLSALAPPKPQIEMVHYDATPKWPASVSEAAKKPKRVPTMQERAAWFHHNQTTVADQVGFGPRRPSLLTRLWLLMCRAAARTEMALLRLL